MRLFSLQRISLLVILLGFYESWGQKLLTDQELVSKFSVSSKSYPENILFIHTDKNIYTSNEDIWFGSYLVKSESVNPSLHSILSVSLISADTRKIYLEKKFAIEYGLASGSIALPDTVPPGDYQLVASTNVVNKNRMPLVSFYQPITIKSITETEFDFQASLLDSVPVGGFLRVKVSMEFQNPGRNDKYRPSVEYRLGSSELKSVKVIGDNSAIISIPANKLTAASNSLHVAVRFKNQVKYATIKLPGTGRPGIKLGIFPEGGYLVEGLASKVGLEIKNSNDIPMAAKCIVLENETPIDTVETNGYGIGSCFITPIASKRYRIQISRNDYIRNDTLIFFPAALKEGAVLSLSQAVINDTLRFKVHSNIRENLKVIIHNFRDGYASFDILANQISIVQSVVLTGVPKGLCAITILNSNGYPVAERLFFVHFDRRATVKTIGGKATYSKRGKVSLRLSVDGPDGLPMEGIISVACVQDNRIDLRKNVDIESFTYLDAQLGSLPVDPVGRGFDNRDYIENILLIKGWRKYTWQGLVNGNSVNSAEAYSILVPTGKVKYLGKELKKPVVVNLMKDLTDFNLIKTSIKGDFDIPISNLTTQEDKMIRATVNEKEKDGYSIELIDSFAGVSAELAKKMVPTIPEIKKTGVNSKEYQLSGLDHTNLLNEVLITSTGNSNNLYGKRRGPNACGDYVIGYSIYYPPANGIKSNYYDISAANSHGKPPEKGVMYRDGMKGLFDNGNIEYLANGSNSRTFKTISLTYDGCIADKDKSIFILDGVYFTRQFYGFDEKLLNFDSPQLLSTL